MPQQTEAERIADLIIDKRPHVAPPQKGRRRYIHRIKQALIWAWGAGHAQGHEQGITEGRQIERGLMMQHLMTEQEAPHQWDDLVALKQALTDQGFFPQ